MGIKNITLVTLVMFVILSNIASIIAHGSDSQKLKIAVDKDIPPYSYIENGKLKGFNVDILEAMKRYMNHGIDIFPMDWKSAVDALKNGSIDALCGMVPTPERNKSFDFSDGYISIDYYIFQNRKLNPIENLSDLNGEYRVVVIEGDVSENYVRNNFKNVSIIESADTLNALIMLDKGIADLFVGEIHTTSYFISKMNLNNVRLTNLEVITYTAAIAVKKRNEEILAEINYSLNKIKESGEYTKIYSMWFSKQNVEGENKWYQYFIYALYAIVIALAVLGVLFIHDRFITRKVKNLEDTQKILLENIPVGIIFLKGSEIEYINRYALKILEQRGRRIKGSKLDEMINKKGEVHIITKKGKKWLIVNSVGYGDRRMIIFMDITSRKVMELRDMVRFHYVNDMLDRIRNPVQNILTASEKIEDKEMQEIIKSNVKKLSEILKKELPE